ncbi:response regulator receiver protein [Deinococcus roseus]|uniref:Uncharacterized protein n=1 Tax=Deinococcus roseus TaxID=392414 RepID=A0ABQ2D0A9_9DEIO|nr:response regulator receiver protein [Deinococcus roseus]GGJ33686.1 hypothetical protein GCM10008938_19920 [Deinococcus roseus]
MSKTDYNTLMNEVIEITRRTRKLARTLGNEAAYKQAEEFEQGAGNAYRNRNVEHLEDNLTALKELEKALKNNTVQN